MKLMNLHFPQDLSVEKDSPALPILKHSEVGHPKTQTEKDYAEGRGLMLVLSLCLT